MIKVQCAIYVKQGFVNGESRNLREIVTVIRRKKGDRERKTVVFLI